MTKNDKNPYFCIKCSHIHTKGEIYKTHKEFDREKISLKDSYDIIRKNIKKTYCYILEDIDIPKEALHIEHQNRNELITKIKCLITSVYTQIRNKIIPYIDIPLRSNENIVYNKYGHLYLGNKTQRVEFGDKYSEFLGILKVCNLVKNLLEENISITKRDIFYNDVKLFEAQRYSDKAIENTATLLGTFRKDLHIVANPRGGCVGSLQIREKSDIIDLKTLGSGTWQISPFVDQIEILESDAEFILVIEKNAVLLKLIENKFWNYFPCILITSQGNPNYATRSLLQRLIKELKIPAFGLVDSDPYGLNILMNYAFGSIQSAYETKDLMINNFYWLGVLASDLEDYNIPKISKLQMTNHDIKRAQELLDNYNIKNNIKLRDEVKLMLDRSQKVEIQALSTHGFNFITEEYLPKKLSSSELIRLT